MKIVFPVPNQNYCTANNVRFQGDAQGVCDIGSLSPLEFYAMGAVPFDEASGATGTRPTAGNYPGAPFFDTKLGKPIWRNAANTGWVDATGTAA
jgi:hypothetical protein